MKIGPPRVNGEQRRTLAERRARLSSPRAVLEVLGAHLGGEPPLSASAVLLDASPDRFVLRVEAQMPGGGHNLYAFKVYADGRGERLWRIAQALREEEARAGRDAPLCLPLAYVPQLGLAVFPWVHGVALREAIRGADAAHLGLAARDAAATLAWVHRAQIPAEAPRTAQSSLERAYLRCAKFARWPDALGVVQPLLSALTEALPSLEPSPATFVHGDPGPANLLYDGRRWVLIDLDRCGLGDPAHDIGYLLAQLVRRGLEQPALAPHVPQAAATLEDRYRQLMPMVPARNIAFYFAVTLAQKLFMTWREHAAAPRAAVLPLVQRGLAALGEPVEA